MCDSSQAAFGSEECLDPSAFVDNAQLFNVVPYDGSASINPQVLELDSMVLDFFGGAQNSQATQSSAFSNPLPDTIPFQSNVGILAAPFLEGIPHLNLFGGNQSSQATQGSDFSNFLPVVRSLPLQSDVEMIAASFPGGTQYLDTQQTNDTQQTPAADLHPDPFPFHEFHDYGVLNPQPSFRSSEPQTIHTFDPPKYTPAGLEEAPTQHPTAFSGELNPSGNTGVQGAKTILPTLAPKRTIPPEAISLSKPSQKRKRKNEMQIVAPYSIPPHFCLIFSVANPSSTSQTSNPGSKRLKGNKKPCLRCQVYKLKVCIKPQGGYSTTQD
jgi:hypothetical protein